MLLLGQTRLVFKKLLVVVVAVVVVVVVVVVGSDAFSL